MSDLISREALISALRDEKSKAKKPILWHAGLIFAEDIIKAQPSAEPKTGKWIEKSTGGEHFDCCSECGYVEWDAPNNYCPYCGARMDADDAEYKAYQDEMSGIAEQAEMEE